MADGSTHAGETGHSERRRRGDQNSRPGNMDSLCCGFFFFFSFFLLLFALTPINPDFEAGECGAGHPLYLLLTDLGAGMGCSHCFRVAGAPSTAPAASPKYLILQYPPSPPRREPLSSKVRKWPASLRQTLHLSRDIATPVLHDVSWRFVSLWGCLTGCQPRHWPGLQSASPTPLPGQLSPVLFPQSKQTGTSLSIKEEH